MSAPDPRLGSPAGEGERPGGRTLGGGWPCGGGQRAFSPPSPPPPPRHGSCCAGSGGGLHPHPRSSAGCAGALSAYSLKWEIRALRNGECACVRARSPPLSPPPARPEPRAAPPPSPGPAPRPAPPPPAASRGGQRRAPATPGPVGSGGDANSANSFWDRCLREAARRGDAGCHERG